MANSRYVGISAEQALNTINEDNKATKLDSVIPLFGRVLTIIDGSTLVILPQSEAPDCSFLIQTNQLLNWDDINCNNLNEVVNKNILVYIKNDDKPFKRTRLGSQPGRQCTRRGFVMFKKKSKLEFEITTDHMIVANP